MATKVVGFKIEIKGEKDIITTTKVLGLLNTQLILINTTLREINKKGGVGLKKLSKEFKQTGSSAKQLGTMVKGSFDTFRKGNKVVQDLGNGFFEVTKRVERTGKELRELTKVKKTDSKSTKDLIKRNKELKKILEAQPIGKQSKAVKQLTKEYAKNNDAIKDFRKALIKGKAASEDQEGSLDQLRKKAARLKKEYNALSGAQQNAITGQGAKIRKSLLATQKRIQKLDLAVKDGRSSIGLYGNATRKLVRTFLQLSVGREIILGLFRGLAGIVEQNKDIDASAKSISNTFEKLKNAATQFGLAFIKLVAAPLELFVGAVESVSLALFGVGFGAGKASEGVRDLQNEFNAEIEVLKRGNISVEARKQLIEDINTKYKDYLPNLIDENANLEDITKAQDAANVAFTKKILLLASEEQFVDITKRRLDALREEAVLQRELSVAESKKIRLEQQAIELFRDFDTKAAERVGRSAVSARRAVDAINKRIEAGKANINQIEEEKKILDEVIKSEGINTADFISNKKKEAKADIDSGKKRAEIRNKRNEQIKKDRLQLLEDIKSESLARIEIAKDLDKQLRNLEIDNIRDSTERALAAEKERFDQENIQRQDNFNDRINQIVEQEATIQALFGFNSKELEAFIEQSGQELLAINATNNKIEEIQARQHQETLLQIQKDGDKAKLDAREKAFQDVLFELEVEQDTESEAEGRKSDAIIAKQIEGFKKQEEAQKEADAKAQKARVATKDAIVNLVNVAINAISTMSQIAFEAEDARFQNAIEIRQNNISALNEDLQNATGLQKKFLEIQVKQEQAALEKETEARKKAQKKQAEDQKAIAIVQAIIAGALAIVNAFTLPPPASFIAAAATAFAVGAQIAAIASQQFAKGGKVGAGNIGTQPNGDNVLATVKTGEVVLNESQQAALGGAKTFAAINVPGFQGGGIVGAPLSAPTVANSQTDVNTKFNQFIDATMKMAEATNARIDRIQVNLDLNNLADVEDNDTNLEALTTFS